MKNQLTLEFEPGIAEGISQEMMFFPARRNAGFLQSVSMTKNKERRMAEVRNPTSLRSDSGAIGVCRMRAGKARRIIASIVSWQDNAAATNASTGVRIERIRLDAPPIAAVSHVESVMHRWWLRAWVIQPGA